MIKIVRIEGEECQPVTIQIPVKVLKDDTYKLENILLKSGSGEIMRLPEIEFSLRTVKPKQGLA